MRLTEYIYGQSPRDSVTVFDVGCSGASIGDSLAAFGSALHVVGFDPLVIEIERLKAAETRPNFSYEAAYVGLDAEQQREKETCLASMTPLQRYYPAWFARSSAHAYAQLTALEFNKEAYNDGKPLVYSNRHLSIDQYTAGNSVEFLKIDTDGFEMDVLIGADMTLRSSVLGLHVECMLHGRTNPYANCLASIDRHLTERGFSLYTMLPISYTRATLPGEFRWALPAQTTTGQMMWADVVFFRDLCADGYADLFDFKVTPERILQLASLFELFGLPDCAAELIIKHGDMLPFPADTLLDLLVPDNLGTGISYREYMRRFAADPAALSPVRQSDRAMLRYY